MKKTLVGSSNLRTIGPFVDLSSRPLGWLEVVTSGPLGVNDLEGRVLRVKTDLKDSPWWTTMTPLWVYRPVRCGRWMWTESIGLPGVCDVKGRVTKVKTDLRHLSILVHKGVFRESVV